MRCLTRWETEIYFHQSADECKTLKTIELLNTTTFFSAYLTLKGFRISYRIQRKKEILNVKNEDLILNFFNTLEKEILRSQVVQKASKAYKKSQQMWGL